MEYVPGIKINKIQALDQLGVDRQRLIQSPAFHLGEILFTWGQLLCFSVARMIYS
jgi:predicted unusual protein kinase regulating ubiquinone biosynthesis (AarF/ABC1/UbiB family)